MPTHHKWLRQLADPVDLDGVWVVVCVRASRVGAVISALQSSLCNSGFFEALSCHRQAGSLLLWSLCCTTCYAVFESAHFWLRAKFFRTAQRESMEKLFWVHVTRKTQIHPLGSQLISAASPQQKRRQKQKQQRRLNRHIQRLWVASLRNNVNRATIAGAFEPTTTTTNGSLNAVQVSANVINELTRALLNFRLLTSKSNNIGNSNEQVRWAIVARQLC